MLQTFLNLLLPALFLSILTQIFLINPKTKIYVRSAGHLVPPTHYIITILLPVVPLSVVAPQNGKYHLSRTIAPDERNIGIV